LYLDQFISEEWNSKTKVFIIFIDIVVKMLTPEISEILR
jgi:hypothetical protein